MMHLSDYKKRRTEVLEDPEQKKREAIAAARSCDREARDKDAREREERDVQRREKLRAQLEAADEETTRKHEPDGSGKPPKKKKKKVATSDMGALSFDADEG